MDLCYCGLDCCGRVPFPLLPGQCHSPREVPGRRFRGAELFPVVFVVPKNTTAPKRQNQASQCNVHKSGAVAHGNRGSTDCRPGVPLFGSGCRWENLGPQKKSHFRHGALAKSNGAVYCTNVRWNFRRFLPRKTGKGRLQST